MLRTIPGSVRGPHPRSLPAVPLFSKAGVDRQPDPPPLETDDVKIVVAGAVIWVVALVVLTVASLAGADVPGWWIVMCACGAALGLVGVGYCRRRAQAIARDKAAGIPHRG